MVIKTKRQVKKIKNNALVPRICNLPKEFEQVENKSISQLLKETGFSRNKAKINIENIKNYLKNNVSLVETWLLYSMNKRIDEGWYFNREDKNTYSVGYLFKNNNKKDESKYSDAIQACATFIYKEIADIEIQTQ